MKQFFRIEKVDCSGCASTMEEHLLSLEHIDAASINMDKQTLFIDGGQLEAAWIQDFLRRVDPDVIVLEPSQDHEKHPHHEGSTDETRRVLLSAILFSAGVILHGFTLHAYQAMAISILFGMSYLVCGLPVLKRAIKLIRQHDFFNEFTLMSFASLTAIFLGDLPEATGVMLFYSIGELFQERAAQKSRSSIQALLAQKPTVAHVLRDGITTDTPPDNVVQGDFVLVKPGERIPTDGIVHSGSSRVDNSSLTGESMPQPVQLGDKLFGGSVNMESTLVLEASGGYEDSSIAKILEMVENAVARKSKTERFITRFSRHYTRIVVACAASVAFLPPLLGMGELRDWGYRALVLLVISCPCALLISIPLGTFGGIGGASRKGILIKGGNVLDALKDVDSVFFDKTGTLTLGVFEVTSIAPASGVSREALSEAAALTESQSNHPIARSIQKALGTPPIPSGAHFMEIPGKGVRLEVNGSVLLAGNRALLKDNGIVFHEETTENESVVYLAENEQYLGHIVISDKIRPDAAHAIARLRGLGIKRIGMLSGDKASIAKQVAEALGIDTFRAELLPDEKVQALHELSSTTGKSLFVGDGVNDAPILATSGVGVAIGGLGSDVAIEVADAVILDDNIEKVADLLVIAKKTRRIILQNITLALGTKGLFILLGIAGEASLWQAVFADVGVALLAVLNSSRAVRS